MFLHWGPLKDVSLEMNTESLSVVGHMMLWDKTDNVQGKSSAVLVFLISRMAHGSF